MRCDTCGASVDLSSSAASGVGVLDGASDLVVDLYVTCTGRCLDAVQPEADGRLMYLHFDRLLGEEHLVAFSRLLTQYRWTTSAVRRLKNLYIASRSHRSASGVVG